jgi:DNA repair protein RecO (recombination protein O)
MPPVASLRTPALVLRKFEYGETSQVLHLLTRDRGRVHVLAKGSMKPRSSFLGPLDVLECGEARIYPRREGLSILGGFERHAAFPGIRRSLERLEAAFGVLEVLGGAAREDHEDPDLFDLALETLRAMEACPGERLGLALVRFDLRLLAVLGVGPVLDACMACGGTLAGGPPPLLSPARGGALCGRCRDQDPLAVPATRGVLAAMALLGGSDGAPSARLVLGPRDLRLARRLCDALLRHLLEREVRGSRAGRTAPRAVSMPDGRQGPAMLEDP